MDISHNGLSGSLPKSLEDGDQLQALDVSDDRLGGKLPNILKPLASLRVPKLSFNSFEGEVPAWVWGLPKLQFLDLSENFFSGSIRGDAIVLGGMSNSADSSSAVAAFSVGIYVGYLLSQFLNGSIGGIQFVTSEVPWDAQVDATVKGTDLIYSYILPSLALVDLFMNEFTGAIPPDFETLQLLKNLNLSQNLFRGQLNSELGSLGELDVSANLSGQIPSTLLDLQSLETLGMAYNNFSGCIQTGKQFSTFGDSSYRPGNPFLLGFPVSASCGELPATANITASEESSGTNFENIFSVLAVGIGSAVGFLSTAMLLSLNRGCQLALFWLVKMPARDYGSYNRKYG